MVLSKGAHFLLSSSMTVNHDKGIRLYILDILKKSVSVHSPVVKHLSYIYIGSYNTWGYILHNTLVGVNQLRIPEQLCIPDSKD